MADVLNLETESTPLNTQLETPELESATELAEPLLESTPHTAAPTHISDEPQIVEAASVATDLDFAAPEASEPEVVLPPVSSAEPAPEETAHAAEPGR